MEYPYYLQPDITFMTLPKSYQEFLIRWYYYNLTDETQIPATVPIESIEEYIVAHMNPSNVWCAKGFVSARNVDAGDNLDFKNDTEFWLFCIYIARLYYVHGTENYWFKSDITKEEFKNECKPLLGIHV